MRVNASRVALLAGALVAALAAAGTVGGATRAEGQAAKGGTLVFGASSDPAVLDGALVSDGESFRPIHLMVEGLIGLKPGTTTVIPKLATSWKVSKNGRTWTFNLRKGVKFHDGTAFNGAAVCYNFNRWYNFKGPFQDPSATYYWQNIFGGFKKNENPDLGASLYQSCKAPNASTAVITLTKRSGPFLSSLAVSSFSIASPKALKTYGADQAELRNGVFQATGTYGFQHPTGTGPYKFESWTLKEKLVLVRNASYWGPKAKNDRIIFRPISDNTARLQALQTGELNGYDNLAPQDIPTVKSAPKLKVVDRPPFNVAYVTINQAKPPMNNLLVRQAVAYGLDRKSVVNSFYAGRASVADEFMPPQVFGYAKDVVKYQYDPEKAKSLLRKAGLTLPVKIEFWYPTNVTRPYMPDPKRNFEAFSASLEKSGFQVEAHSAPWRPDYVGKVNEGSAGHLNLIGWTGDYGDPDNFIGTFFQGFSPQFGFKNAKLTKLLDQAEAETNQAKRIKLYQEANRQIMKFLPGVPYAHSRPALGFQRAVNGFIASPVGEDEFANVTIGGQ